MCLKHTKSSQSVCIVRKYKHYRWQWCSKHGNQIKFERKQRDSVRVHVCSGSISAEAEESSISCAFLVVVAARDKRTCAFRSVWCPFATGLLSCSLTIPSLLSSAKASAKKFLDDGMACYYTCTYIDSSGYCWQRQQILHVLARTLPCTPLWSVMSTLFHHVCRNEINFRLHAGGLLRL